MKYQLLIFASSFIIISSCVSKKDHDKVLSEKEILTEDMERCNNENFKLTSSLEKSSIENRELQTQVEKHAQELETKTLSNDQLKERVSELEELNEANQHYQSSYVKLREEVEVKNKKIEDMNASMTKIAYSINGAKYSDISETGADWAIDAELRSQLVEEVDQKNAQLVYARTQAANRTNLDTVANYKISSGNIAIYCPDRMIYNQTYDVMSVVADLLSDDELKSNLIASVQNHNPDLSEEVLGNNDLLIEKILYYGMVELVLNNVVNEGFTITQVHANNKQKIEEGMEGWHWKVTPTSQEPNQQLIVQAKIYNPDGTSANQFSKTYRIDVNVDMTKFWHKLKMLIVENPAWAMTTLIIPFLTFLWGRFSARKVSQKPT